MKAILTTLLTISFISFLPAQQAPDLKWGKVDDAVLTMTEYAPDPDAGAVVLADVGRLTFDFIRGISTKLERHRRIKILNRSGFSEGDIQIIFQHGDRAESISGLKAQVFAPDGTKTTLKKRDFYEEELDENFSVIKFSFPQLQDGSVIEYRYTRNSEYIFQLGPWYFQEDIPVRWSSIQVEVPEWYNYVTLTQGRSPDINELTEEPRTLQMPRGGGFVPYNGNVKVLYMAMSEVPAMQEEPFITTMRDYYASLRLQLSEIEFPGEYPEPVLKDWQTVCQELMDHSGFGEQITNSRKFDDAVRAVQGEVGDISDPREQLIAAYEFLKSKLSWNGRYDFVAGQDLNACFSEGTGSSAELNLLLVAVLNEIGIPASPLLISTRNHGQMFEVYPFLSQFNHVLAIAVVDEEALVLDLVNPLLPAGMPDVNSLNSRALLVNPAQPQWINLPAPLSKAVYFGKATLDADGTLTGNMRTSYDGYAGLFVGSRHREDSAGDYWDEELQELFPGAEISGLQGEGAEDPYAKVKEEYNFRIANYAMAASDMLYVTPVLYTGLETNPFTEEERAFPLNIPYPIEEKYIYNLTIPEGYQIAEAPEPTRLLMDGNSGLFQYNISQTDAGVQVIVDIRVSKLIYQPDEYAICRGFFEEVERKLSEPVVLQKI